MKSKVYEPHFSCRFGHLRLVRQLLPNAEIKVFRHNVSDDIPEFSNGNLWSIDEVMSFSPELAVIANPATFHIEIAKTLAERGTHLLIEKPISDSVKDVSGLIDLCKSMGIVLSTGYDLRFSPSLRFFRQLLISGEIGEVLSVRSEVGQYLPKWRPSKDYRETVSAQKKLGGGVLLELSHEIDYIRWIFGEVAWVKATLSQQSALEIDVEDTAMITLGLKHSVSKKIILCSLNMDFIRRDHTRTCTAIGATGTLLWDGVNGEVHSYTEDKPNPTLLFSHPPIRDETILSEWEDFLVSIRKNRSPQVTGIDGLKVMQIVEAVRESSRTGVKVQLANVNKDMEVKT
jgi:predicted dehydrogenase